MLQTVKNAWKIPDLRRKILFTFLILLIFRVGSAIAVPFVDVTVMKEVAGNPKGALSVLTMLSGGGFSRASLFSLAIQPYINASIIVQLLTVAIPALENLSKEGEAGRKKLEKITRIVTIFIGLLLGTSYFLMIKNLYGALKYPTVSTFAFWFSAVVIVLAFTAGATFVMWLGQQIDEKGIGNGISMILFAGILSGAFSGLKYLWDVFYTGIKTIDQGGLKYIILIPIVLIMFLAIIVFIVIITEAERRIPVQYAKRVVGRKMYGGQSSFIPIKVNMSGVMPVILAVTMTSVPQIIFQFTGVPKGGIGKFINDIFQQTHPFYIALYVLLIVGFAFFYVTMQYNPVEMANDLRKNSGAIPGYRPGKPTSDYIGRVLNKITLVGAIALGIIAVIPILFGKFSNLDIQLGGTSIMIVVGVALETTQQLESQMMMRHYKGFLD